MFISSAYRWAMRSVGSLTTGIVRRMAGQLVCIPTYKEAANILRLVERVHEAAPDSDVLVIDDASPDGTGDLVRDRMLKDARLDIMARPGKLGVGPAYMAGFASGLQHGYSSVLTMDADFSHPPDRIPALLGEVERGAHLSVGSRSIPRGASSGPWAGRPGLRDQGMGGGPPGAERDRELRGAAAVPASHPRFHRRLSLLQSSRLAVPRHPAAAIVRVLGADRAIDPVRTRGADDRRSPDHVYRAHDRPIEDLAPGDLSRDADRVSSRRAGFMSRRRLIQAAVLL